MNEPLILTLQLDAPGQKFYEELRQRYFPPERNLIPAHLTLFHHLPDEDFVEQTIAEEAGANATFELANPKLRSLGRGVAVFFESVPLMAVHAALAGAFDADLIPQDRQRFRPHIVVQNKVDLETARQTLQQMQCVTLVAPQADGLTLWRYLGGPWERVSDFRFGSRRISETGS